MGKKKKVLLPPDLPPDIGDDEIEVSAEDLDFVKENRKYAGLFKNLDTKSINKYVARVADVKDDDLEALYERRNKKASLKKQPEESELQVDPVDALPVKTLDGKIYYRTAKELTSNNVTKEDDAATADATDNNQDKSIVRLTKAERRAKLKKTKKEAKRQAKDEAKVDEEEKDPHSEVLTTVEKDLSAEELLLQKKNKLAEIGLSLLEDPDTNIKSLKELMDFCNDANDKIVKLGLLSLLAVFKDIIPGYRIRLPTEKELEMKVSKDVRKMRFYESTLLRSYKAYLQRLIALEKKPSFQHVAVRCMCSLLDAVPHFNFRENLLVSAVKNISSPDDVIRKLCCTAIMSIFINEGKHGGEATVEAVQLIANHVKGNNCQLHPDCIEVFLSLKFDEDLGKSEPKEVEKVKPKNKKQKQNTEEQKKYLGDNRKLSRQELAAKTREEVNADLRAASFVTETAERRRMQSETLSAVFETYFRILKHSMGDITSADATNKSSGGSDPHPLLASCLRGLAKFSHLLDLDFMGDLMACLKKLAGYGGYHTVAPSEFHLSVSERIQCCVVAFKVMRNNLDALNVDLQDFFVHLYNLLLEYKPDRSHGEVLAEALKIMLVEGKQHDMQRAAAFVKRLATFALCFGSAEAMAALVTLKHLLQKNSKCRNLLENDSGGGSLSGLVVKYQPDAADPNLSGALASVLWELSLLTKHYHPSISSMASSISSLGTAQNQVYISTASPQQAFAELFIEREIFKLDVKLSLKDKRKRGRGAGLSSLSSGFLEDMEPTIDEDEVRAKLESHFTVLRDISENERLRGELNKSARSISLYKEYLKQKKTKRSKKSENSSA